MADAAQLLKRKQIESKTTDAERWRWLMKNSGTCNFVVMLDNDQTYIADYASEENDWHNQPSFDLHIGNAPGIPLLLAAVGIKSEYV